MSQRPPLRRQNLSSFPRMYEEYFNDHFGFRSFLIRWNSFRKFLFFGIVPGDKVYAGKNGWLFYRPTTSREGYASLNHAGGLPDNDIELFEKIRKRLEQNQQYFADLGIGYQIVVVPDKWSIYAEHVPDGFESPSGRTTVEELVDHLRSSTELAILDVRGALLAAKDRGAQVYGKGDTHWNDLGAFIAAQAITAEISRSYVPLLALELADFTQRPRHVGTADLITLMGLDGFFKHRTVDLVPREPAPFQLSEQGEQPRTTVVSFHRDRTLPRAVILRDSFGDAAIPYLSRCFGETHFMWTVSANRLDVTPVLQDIRPELVVEIKVERFMLDLIKYFNGPWQQRRDENR